MDNLEELKQINDDLPFTKFPDEIDEYTPFSDADDNINNMISRYRTLMKQGNITEANTIYQEYNLGSYIIGAKFLNKIQHMIIACERAISSVKKYFTFSINEPDGSIAQPNGYVWGKILSAQNGFKNVLLKLKESGSYNDIYPITTIDNVWKSEKSGITETLTDVIQDIKDTHDLDIENLDNNKMDKNNPKGTGSLALNRLESDEVGENAVIFGDMCSATGKSSFACGSRTRASNNYATAFGYKNEAPNVANFVIGKYNDNTQDAPFAIGGGSSDTDRYNVFNVDWDGNVVSSGKIISKLGVLTLQLYDNNTLEKEFTFEPYWEVYNGVKLYTLKLNTILNAQAVFGDAKVSLGNFTDTADRTLCMTYNGTGNSKYGRIGVVETAKSTIGNGIKWNVEGQMTIDSYTSSSDERLKKDFDTLDKIDNVFMELEPVSFRYRYNDDNNIHIGFKAQDVKNALNKNDLSEDDYAMFQSIPKLHDVEELKDSDTEYQISYQEFTAWNTHMIQKVVRENESLRNELAEIRSKVDSLSR